LGCWSFLILSLFILFLNLFICFCFLIIFLFLFFPICICFFLMFFCFDSYSFKSLFLEIIKYVFLFYSMLIGFFERAGAGVDTDRLACIFSWQPQCASRVWLTHVPDLPR
jgi:hypothetical protein